MRVTRVEGRQTTEFPLSAEQLPIEIYFKLGFGSLEAAAEWCTRAVESLGRVQGNDPDLRGHRIVVWGPRGPERGVRRSGYGTVFLSELAIRQLRALQDVPVPQSEIVTVSALEYDLHMYRGSPIDEATYRRIRSD